CVITYFTKCLFAFDIPKHQRSQKQKWRWFFTFKDVKDETWSEFNAQAEQKSITMENQRSHLPHRSSLNYDHRVLNYQWQIFKTAILQSAYNTLSKRKVSPFIYQDKLTSDELKHLQLQNSLLNQI